MAEINTKLSGVAETLLITLAVRAEEAQRPDAFIRDWKAVAIVKQLSLDFPRLRLHAHDKVAIILRLREFDRIARDFMRSRQDAVVVHVGCGLDTRFDRVDDGRVEWYDLDLPEVVTLRDKLLEAKGERYHLLSGSVFDTAWMDAVSPHHQRPFLFIAEGVLPYFEEAQVKSLVLMLRDHFPGAELACDGYTPLIVRLDNLQLAFSKIRARLRWKLKRARDVEGWGEGIRLVKEWYYFDCPEPRLGAVRWMRHFPALGKATGVFHYRLG